MSSSIDLSHHLNEVSRSQIPSPLKQIFKYMEIPGMISLASGLPNPSVFPFESLAVKAFAPDANLDPGEMNASGSSGSIAFSLSKYPFENEPNTLSTALQYGTGSGSATLTSFLRDFTARVMKPGYTDWAVLLNCGNTDAWSKVVGLLCEKDDYILIEEHTFASAQRLWAPICNGVPVAVDGEGLIPQKLNEVLERWDVEHPGVKRPHLLYTVPVGQNPTGATMGLERKKQIYEICVKYDVIICEDDPYYFLQMPSYVLPSQRHQQNGRAAGYSEQEFLDFLVPTFVNVDYQGRVIRLETFSKTLGPGNRLGYFVCNPVFEERLLRSTEVTTQSAGGWSQAIIEQLIVSQWGQGGLLRWMKGLGEYYTIRRDWMCDFLSEEFDMESSPGATELIATAKGSGCKTPYFTFTPAKAGMFLWIKLYLGNTALFKTLQIAGEQDAEERWAEKFWASLIEEKVLLVPGSYYVPIIGSNDERMKSENGVTFFRLTFAYESKEEMQLGIQRMARVFAKYWSE
ncbi:PLP-dependent transferase [Gymnopus androsaceus JB14]|uniref:PLP-dependent transferase n=1 Tax=Gymnopus androsaceus JB14 TaxID=1447944 RepID=A0A6A4HWM5_9AGAR|nr:PLP-dependent transferase [Gymnopus androsaceus JB14]